MVVTEKIHATNFTVLVDADGTHIGSHNYFRKNNETNKNLVYIRAYNEHPDLHKLPPNTQVFGEIYGVQDLKYNCTNGKIGVAIFAVKYWGQFLDYSDFLGFCENYDLPMVPQLYVGPYYEDLADKWNNMDSILCPQHMMEGIIIQPVIERTHPEIGRVCLKRISDRYLLRQASTELH